MNKLKLTLLQQEILRFFFKNTGRSFNALQLAKALKVSAPAITKALPFLGNNKLLKIQQDSSRRLKIELNRENHVIIWLKRVDNLKHLYESGLVDLFYEKFPSATVILFGSFSLGEDTVDSDIDIAIIGAKAKKLDLEQLETELLRPISLNFYKSLANVDPNLRINILSGILLKGWIEL